MSLRALGGLAVLAGLVSLMAAAPSARASDDEPVFGSGWVLRSGDAGGVIAGNAEQGFVVLGANDRDNPVTDAHYSPDGLTWERIEFQSPQGDPWGVISVAAGESGFVATGPPGEDGTTFVSFSADGRTWEPIPPEDLALPSFQGSPTLVTAGPAGFVTLVSFGCDLGAWYSPDGRDWTQSSELPPGCINAVVTSTSSGWHMVADSESDDAIVATSVDGTTWDVIDAEAALPSAVVAAGGALAVHGDTWAFLGFTPEPPGTTPVVWTSDDSGVTWAQREVEIVGDAVEGGYQPVAMVVTEAGFVGTGQVETLDDTGGSFVVSSPDGTTWREEQTTGNALGLVATDDMLIVSRSSGVYTWEQIPTDRARTDTDLAETGTDTNNLMAIAIGLLVTGTAVLAVRRRLPSPSSPGRHNERPGPVTHP